MLHYVGRYTHRVAISNNRLLDMDQDRVSFYWKDYRPNDRQKTMTLSAEEFIRRFLIHVLPDGFQRIRYYGFLANDYQTLLEKVTGSCLRECPICHQGQMIAVEVLPPRGSSFTDTS